MNTTSKHIKTYREIRDQYPALTRAAEIMPPPPADILGRDLNELRRGLRNPEKANIALLAEPGTGKTAYVQGFAYDDDSLPYYLVLEVNPERLIDPNGDRESSLLTGMNQLLDEAGQYSKDNNVIVVLFVDEFHKILQYSPSLTESLKPRLEKSALYGFRLIAATTFQEYNETVALNRALDQRFLQIKLTELPKEAVIHVLENRAKQHGVIELLDAGVLEDIYIESKRILMSNAQPRASIDILNSMIGDTVKGEYMEHGRLIKEYYTPAELGLNSEKVVSRPLLKRVIKRMHGIDIDNSVDVRNVINALQTRLFNQDNAIEVVVHLLEMAAQGFSDVTRPKFSFLSTGTTGVGKSLPDTWDIPAPVPNGYIRNGDIKVGDYVYNRRGKPVLVSGVFPQGERTVYRVTLGDGRQIDCAGDHLWTYKDARDSYDNLHTVTTECLMNIVNEQECVIPQNGATERKEKGHNVDPYGFGIAIREKGILAIPKVYKLGSIRQRSLLIQGLFGLNEPVKSNSKIDTSYTTISKKLINDIQEILWSLGIMSNVRQIGNKYTIYVEQERHIDFVAIKSVKKLNRKVPMTCIMVEDDEHLYLAGKEHIVTHNTEMAKIISETMMIPLKRFDMSRYGDPLMAKDFADALFQAAWATPNAYILIDEVEKSSKRAMNILLQVLDDARLTDSVNPDRVASFTGCIINLTTNVGSEVYQNMQKFQSESAEADAELVYKALVNAVDSDGKPLFETAVLGRVDEIVPFHPLPTSALEKIARRTLDEAIETANTRDRKVIVSDDIIPYIVKDRTSNDTERGGARDAKRNVRNIVVQQLAHYLTYAKAEVPVIIYLKGKPRFKFTDVADPLNAHVAIMECYPLITGGEILRRLAEQIDKPLINRGLYFPVNRPLQSYVQELTELIRAGYFQFYTHIDGEEVTIRGV